MATEMEEELETFTNSVVRSEHICNEYTVVFNGSVSSYTDVDQFDAKLNVGSASVCGKIVTQHLFKNGVLKIVANAYSYGSCIGGGTEFTDKDKEKMLRFVENEWIKRHVDMEILKRSVSLERGEEMGKEMGVL